MKQQRKTKTSTSVKRRYNEKVYGRLTFSVPKQLAEDFKEKCANDGVSYASVLKNAVEEYMENGTSKE